MCFVLLTGAASVYADADDLSDEEKEVLPDSKNFILKYYNGYFIHLFAEKKSIEEITESPDVGETVYVYRYEDEDNIYQCTIRNNKTDKIVWGTMYEANVFVDNYRRGAELLKSLSVSAEIVVWEDVQRHGDSNGGIESVEKLYDIKKYEVRP